MNKLLEKIFFPKLTRWYLLRVALVALAAYLFFGHVCIPCVIDGASMMPTYPSHGLNFCWCPALWYSTPQRGDIVVASYVGRRVLFLKRVAALEGDTVEFRSGTLFVNGVPQEEPWLMPGTCDWELPPRIVEKGNVYLVGDNRTMPIDEHIFGQLPVSRIIGKPLW